MFKNTIKKNNLILKKQLKIVLINKILSLLKKELGKLKKKLKKWMMEWMAISKNLLRNKNKSLYNNKSTILKKLKNKVYTSSPK